MGEVMDKVMFSTSFLNCNFYDIYSLCVLSCNVMISHLCLFCLILKRLDGHFLNFFQSGMSAFLIHFVLLS